MAKLINIDNGGTLTDIWVLDGKSSYHTKTITTPYDLSSCFFEGLRKVSEIIYGQEDLPSLLQSTDYIRYSTTQGTNALVTKKGPRLGLIIGPQSSGKTLARTAKEQEMFAALVGDRIVTLDNKQSEESYRKSLLDAINQLSLNGASRIVVSYDGDDYLASEAQFRRANLALFPKHLLGALPVLFGGSLSSDQDYGRRTWTALNNAFLHPAMERFLFNAETKLRDYRLQHPLLIYRNDGYAGRVAKTVAIKTYSSGPRSGMESARAYAEYYDFSRCLTMDVGGTTTDIGLVENNKIKDFTHGEVEGVSCSLALCDIVSIGVGGGSIFRVLDNKIIVGPDSVGGAPGPACFGMGGKEATITDALLIMGLIDPSTYFGGELVLDSDRALAVIEENIATPMQLTTAAAAHVMLETWADNIAIGLANYTVIEPGTVLSAFGGCGPMGALAVACAANIDTVLVPRLAAVFSAHGIGFSDIAHAADIVLNEHSEKALVSAIDFLQQRVTRDIYSEGFSLRDCEQQLWISVNGHRQALDTDSPRLPQSIGANDDVSVGFKAIKRVHRAELPEQITVESSPVIVDTQRTIIDRHGEQCGLPVVRVDDQQPGAQGRGPAVIEEAYWTCKVEPDWHYEFTANGDVLFRKLSEN